MSYSVDYLYNFLQHITRIGIGSRLSAYKATTGTVPAVFKVKAAGQVDARLTGQLPFAVITSQGRDRRDSSISNRHYSLSGDEVLTTTYDHRFTIGVYGGEAESIACDLEQFFITTEAQLYMAERGVVVTDTFGVRPNTTVLNGVPHDFASLNVKLTVNSAIIQQVYGINNLSIELNAQYPSSNEDISSSTITYP